MSYIKKINIHVLYETTDRGIPHGCGEIRLLRPLAHPSISEKISLTYGVQIPKQAVDVIIVERLWNYVCDLNVDKEAFLDAQAKGAKIIYEIDDDLLSVNSEIGCRPYPTETQKIWIRQMVRSADGVIVSTPNLAARLSQLNNKIEIIPNALDEQLFLNSEKFSSKDSRDEIVFGYMGTFTHLEDLLSILLPLRAILSKYKENIRFEIVGVGDNKALDTLFTGLPVKLVRVPDRSVPYADFVQWFQTNIRWDFGIAPLVDSRFTRSKSDIKFLDYAVQGIPGIFADVPAYQKTIVHGKNGLLASDSNSWFESFQRMVKDHHLRLDLARNAHQQVWEERMLKTEADKWLRAITNIAAINL